MLIARLKKRILARLGPVPWHDCRYSARHEIGHGRTQSNKTECVSLFSPTYAPPPPPSFPPCEPNRGSTRRFRVLPQVPRRDFTYCAHKESWRVRELSIFLSQTGYMGLKASQGDTITFSMNTYSEIQPGNPDFPSVKNEHSIVANIEVDYCMAISIHPRSRLALSEHARNKSHTKGEPTGTRYKSPWKHFDIDRRSSISFKTKQFSTGPNVLGYANRVLDAIPPFAHRAPSSRSANAVPICSSSRSYICRSLHVKAVLQMRPRGYIHEQIDQESTTLHSNQRTSHQIFETSIKAHMYCFWRWLYNDFYPLQSTTAITVEGGVYNFYLMNWAVSCVLFPRYIKRGRPRSSTLSYQSCQKAFSVQLWCLRVIIQYDSFCFVSIDDERWTRKLWPFLLE